MKITTTLILTVFMSVFPVCLGQLLKATTEDGRTVILFPDGTWKFAPQDQSEPSSKNEDSIDIPSEIKSHCASEWPSDFSMRAYCEDKARQAVAKISSLNQDKPVPEEVFNTIWGQCRKQWSIDWAMINYCMEKQIEGYKKIQ